MKLLLLVLLFGSMGCSSLFTPEKSFAVISSMDGSNVVESTVSAKTKESLLTAEGTNLNWRLLHEAGKQAEEACGKLAGTKSLLIKVRSEQKDGVMIVKAYYLCGVNIVVKDVK